MRLLCLSARTSTRVLLLLVPALVVIASGCGSEAEVTTGPSPLKCQVALTMAQSAMGPSGGSGVVAVATQPECSWSVSSTVAWISAFSPASGQGSGEVRFQIAPNPGSASRQGDVLLNGVSVRVSQAGASCAIDIDPRSQTFQSGGGSGSVAVSTLNGCAWSAASNAPWLAVTAGASGSGNGTVGFSVGANTGVARLGTITIGDQTFVATQQAPGATQCAFSIQPASQSMAPAGGNVSVSIQADAGCSWTAASNAAWLAVVGVGTGSGNGSVTIGASANAGTTRVGTVTIATQTFTVTQTGSCAATLNPVSASVPTSGANGLATTVTTATGCVWTASTADNWLTITAGAGGDGNGTVTFNAAVNTGAARAGTLTIANQTFTVNQAGGCTYSINPATQPAPIGGANGGPVTVTAGTGCGWTATTTDNWITITSGASGSGNGSVSYSTAANSGAARTGTITIGGQTFTVNQAGSCSYSINPATQSAPIGGANGGPVTVTAGTGCGWTATTTDNWITITSGASGSGNGSVSYSTAANSGAARTGTITIGGQTFTVNQAGSCAATLNPGAQTAGAGGGAATSVGVTIPAGCAWTATTGATWITITSGASGTGNGTVGFSVAANTGPQRIGTISIAGQNHTVTQSTGCTYSINPTSRTVNQNAQTPPSIAVTAGAGCTWTAVSNDSWITVVTGASGTGNGTVTYSVTQNNGSNNRTGTITIAGRTFTVTQND